MAEYTTSEIIVEYLIKEGIEYVFGTSRFRHQSSIFLS